MLNQLASSFLTYLYERILSPAEAVVHEPAHPYTQALLSVLPSPDPARRGQRTTEESVLVAVESTTIRMTKV